MNKFMHCVSTSIITEDNLDKVLEELQVEMMLRELTGKG